MLIQDKVRNNMVHLIAGWRRDVENERNTFKKKTWATRL